MTGLKGKKVLYGYTDAEHAIECTVSDVGFKGTDILIVASCEGGIITAPIEMFKQIEED